MQVGIVLGKRAQWNTMKHTAELLAHLGITYEARIITANKSYKQLHEYASTAIDRGIEIIIAGSTGDIYLPGIIASQTEVPVVGIQINQSTTRKHTHKAEAENIGNTIRIINTGTEGAINAALFAASILSHKCTRTYEKLIKYRHQNEFGNVFSANSIYNA